MTPSLVPFLRAFPWQRAAGQAIRSGIMLSMVAPIGLSRGLVLHRWCRLAAMGILGSIALGMSNSPLGHPAEAGPAQPPAASSDPFTTKATTFDSCAASGTLYGDLKARDMALNSREQALAAEKAAILAATDRLKAEAARITQLESVYQKQASQQHVDEEQHLAALARLYSTMRPEDAAGILEGMDTTLVGPILQNMPPRRSASILAALSRTKAQRLTAELAVEPHSD